MKVYGYKLTDEQVAAGKGAIKTGCTHRGVVVALKAAGVPDRDWIPHQAATYLLSRERAAERIRYDRDAGCWRRVKARRA